MAQFERKEYKYYVRQGQIESLRNRFLPYMEHDSFCQQMPEKFYTVRSIYLDTLRMLFYYEKLTGLKYRKKLRIRTYNTPTENTKAFLEIKRKIDDTIYKDRAKIVLSDVPKLLKGTDIKLADENPSFKEKTALDRFTYLTRSLNLESKALVTYEREAFVGTDESDLRVTFDMNVRSFPFPSFDDIFREEDLCGFSGKYFILEVKFFGRMPTWVRNVIRDFRLHQQSISKYCNGIDAWPDFDNVREVENL